LYYYSLWHRQSLQMAVQFAETDDARGCNNTICPPEDEQGIARGMLRIVT